LATQKHKRGTEHIMKKATNEQIITAYKKTNNVWKAAQLLGMCGQSVHERLKKLGIKLNNPAFTKKEEKILKARYLLYRDTGNLQELAEQMGRTKYFLCRKAKELGLTNAKHKKLWAQSWKSMSKEDAEILFEKFKKSCLGLGQFCSKYNLGKNGFYDTMTKYFNDEWEHIIELKTPKQSMYRLGRQVEYTARDAFRKEGYFVFRSPASKGPADLVAISKNIVIFVQCKRGMVMGVKEWNDFYDLSKSVNAIPILVGRPKGYGLVYWLLTGKKDGSKRPQPKVEIRIQDIEQITTGQER